MKRILFSIFAGLAFCFLPIFILWMIRLVFPDYNPDMAVYAGFQAGSVIMGIVMGGVFSTEDL